MRKPHESMSSGCSVPRRERGDGENRKVDRDDDEVDESGDRSKSRRTEHPDDVDS